MWKLKNKNIYKALIRFRIQVNDGIFVPHNCMPGRFVFFAIDNCNFNEDTHAGKHTLHGTVMAIYQQAHSNDICPELHLQMDTEKQRLVELPQTTTELIPCDVPKGTKPECPRYESYHKQELQPFYHIEEYIWLLSFLRKITSVQQYRKSSSILENTLMVSNSKIAISFLLRQHIILC